jgi:hypothetical protein
MAMAESMMPTGLSHAQIIRFGLQRLGDMRSFLAKAQDNDVMKLKIHAEMEKVMITVATAMYNVSDEDAIAGLMVFANHFTLNCLHEVSSKLYVTCCRVCSMRCTG